MAQHSPRDHDERRVRCGASQNGPLVRGNEHGRRARGAAREAEALGSFLHDARTSRTYLYVEPPN